MNVFGTIPKTNHLELIESSKPNPKKVAEFLDLSRQDVARVSGVEPATVRYDARVPERISIKLGEIGFICELVAEYFNGDLGKTKLWFHTANPLLGGMAPRDVIRIGRHARVMQLIMDAKNGHMP